MPVLTLVYRTLPFSLPWKRRHSATSTTSSKGKEKAEEIQTPDSYDFSQNDSQIDDCHDAEIPDAPLRCDALRGVHVVAVKQRPDLVRATRNDDDGLGGSDDLEAGDISDSESVESDLNSDCRAHRLAEKCESSALPRLARMVSWASIVRSQCRWTGEQEKKLEDAERQLARCQKAWSSEQELWLAYVQALSEEKEAHSDFLLLRTRQQDEEQHQFRKAWKRRRSLETSLQRNSLTLKKNVSMSNKFRRQQRHVFLAGPPLVATDSIALECRG